jgi:ATP-dependent Clp protease ATP-binding subunit ClpC
MYLAWARARGMHAQLLTPEDPPDGRHVVLVGGLGAATILADEPGLHILEQPAPGDSGDRRVTRISATVAIAPRPAGAAEPPTLAGAEAALATHPAPAAVVRRYCFDPAPLVRDAVRGYRTGRLDRVLAGDFDLF